MQREDYAVTTSDGIKLRARAVRKAGDVRGLIVLVHGISAPLVPTYDLDVKDYSFMEMLAAKGYLAVAFDHRNFGGSDRCAAMAEETVVYEDGRGVHTLDDSLVDIRAVIDDCKERYKGVPRILFGSSRGALQVLAYACEPNPDVELIIMNNPSGLAYLSGVTLDEMPELDGEYAKAHRPQNYIVYTAEHQRERWRKVVGDSETVDKSLQEAYIAACIATDPETDDNTFRVPTEKIVRKEPLLSLGSASVPLLVTEAEPRPAEYEKRLIEGLPKGLLQIVKIVDSDHFTLRNPKRFELANIVDAAACGVLWGKCQ